jgi:hypothetical protein
MVDSTTSLGLLFSMSQASTPADGKGDCETLLRNLGVEPSQSSERVGGIKIDMSKIEYGVLGTLHIDVNPEDEDTIVLLYKSSSKSVLQSIDKPTALANSLALRPSVSISGSGSNDSLSRDLNKFLIPLNSITFCTEPFVLLKKKEAA